MRDRRLRILGILNLALMSCPIAPAANSQVPTADAEFAAGMSAREKADYDAALPHLQRAVDLDATMTKAHFALGLTAQDLCASTAEPGRDLRLFAIREYKKVLELDPSHADAAMNLAYMLYQFEELDESESYYRKALALRADDPEALSAVAAIDFQRSWRDLSVTKAGLNLPPKWPLIHSPSCNEARDRNQARVEEGIALLMRAVQVRNNNSDLMGFLWALHTARAEIQCGNRQAYKADKNAARTWDRKRKETAKRKGEKDFFQKCPPAPPPPPDNE